jgi:hypothetical protein
MSGVADLGSIDGSLVFLAQQSWWQRFRDGRRDVALLDDVMFVGHFCRWLAMRRVEIQDVARAHVDEYVLTLTSMRPGPRAAYERTARGLLTFFAQTSGA